MPEFIVIQVGQCGNQIGSTLWPLVLEEYGIYLSKNEQNSLHTATLKDQLNESFFSYFSADKNFDGNVKSLKLSDLKKFNIKARAVLIDMENSVVDQFQSGPLKNLFDSSYTIKNYPGSGNNWAEGFLTHGRRYSDDIENVIRKSVEKCNSLAGFLLMYSVGGGTGSGLGSFVLKLLNDKFPDVERFVTCVYPNGSEDVITWPYNVALATKYLTDYATCVFPVENRALLEIVNKQKLLNCPSTKTEEKPFQNMNTIIVNMLLHLTSGSRFSGNLNVDLNDISTNLIPYPKMHFLCSSINPITIFTDKCKKLADSQRLHREIFLDCCNKKNQLLKCDPLGLSSVLLGASLIARGTFTISEMRNYLDEIQKRGHFNSWSHRAMKIGLCDVPQIGNDSSMLALFNSSAIISLFDEVLHHFNKLYFKKAHVHHYINVDGFEKSFFNECRETLLYNINNYKSVSVVKEVYKQRIIAL